MLLLSAESPSPPPFDVETTQENVGSSIIKCRELCGGHVFKHQSSVSFIPIPKLWDSQGVRMSLEDDRHPTQPVASVHVRLLLHEATS